MPTTNKCQPELVDGTAGWTPSPLAKAEFSDLNPQQQTNKFLRLLHLDAGDEFVLSLKKIAPGKDDIWKHRLATVIDNKGLLDFEFRHNLVYGERAKNNLGPHSDNPTQSETLHLSGNQAEPDHVYFRPSRFRGRGFGVSKEDVVEVRCWHFEGDGKAGSREEQAQRVVRFEEAGLKLSAVVDSGGKSLHGFIRKPLGLECSWEDDQRIMQKLCVLMEGDTRVITRQQVMRIPGFDRPGGEPQRLLWGQEEIPYESAASHGVV